MSLVFVGCYTNQISPEIIGKGHGIASYQLNTSTFALTPNPLIKQRNPAYLCVSGDHQFLYAVEELAELQTPRVYAYKMAASGELTVINSRLLSGSFACHLHIVNSYLFVCCYGDGFTQIFPIDTDGSVLPEKQRLVHQGNGPNSERQASPHAHMALDVANDLIYIADLGIDRATAYQFDDNNMLVPSLQADLIASPGSGPRHLARHPTLEIVYLLCELSGEVFIYNVANSVAKLVNVVRTIKMDKISSDVSAAAIKISPNGRFLYASNRRYNLMSVFRVDEQGRLYFVKNIELVVQTPRDFSISPDGKVLVVAGQDSHSLALYSIDRNNGILTFIKTQKQLSPSNVLIL